MCDEHGFEVDNLWLCHMVIVVINKFVVCLFQNIELRCLAKKECISNYVYAIRTNSIQQILKGAFYFLVLLTFVMHSRALELVLYCILLCCVV